MESIALSIAMALVPNNLLNKAADYLSKHPTYFENKKYITIVDFSKPSWQKRMFVINTKTGTVRSFHVAHGEGSDPRNTGYAEEFSNISGSHKSSLGFYKVTNSFYWDGSHGNALRMRGLSASNSMAYSRGILIHGANYVWDSNVKQGNTWGCFGMSSDSDESIVPLIENGSLFLAALSEE